MKRLLMIVSTFLFFAVVGCDKTEPNVELIQDMMKSPAIKAQGEDPKRPGEMGNLIPPDGTESIGHIPYRYKGKPDEAERALVNPIAGKNIDRGKQLFETYCFVCHGYKADGHGPVAPKFSVPIPNLMAEKVRKFKDGRIFHIITDGQGLMSTYATQVKNENDRWAIVNYVRSLQKKTQE